MPNKRKSGRNTYTKELLEEAVKASTSIMGVLRYFGLLQQGGNYNYLNRRIKSFGISTAHFLGRASNSGLQWKGGAKARPIEETLVFDPKRETRLSHTILKRSLLSIGRVYECSECPIKGEWNGKPLTLHVDHIDGNHVNNSPENLRFLCPNCHSQTDSFAGRKRRPKSERETSTREYRATLTK